jgi:hypothetical protein
MADDVACRNTRETSMSKHQDRLQQKSPAKPAIDNECGALDDQDLAMVTGGDKAKAKPKEFPTESISLSYEEVAFVYK